MSRLFANTVAELREGTTSVELDRELTKLIEAIRTSGRPGKLIFELTVKPASKGQVNVLSIEDKITIKQPASERGSTILFASDDNRLTRTDPRQPTLKGLREVPGTSPTRPEAADSTPTADTTTPEPQTREATAS